MPHGTGFLVEGGTIITAAHVVLSPDHMKVTTKKGQTVEAELLHIDEVRDERRRRAREDRVNSGGRFASGASEGGRSPPQGRLARVACLAKTPRVTRVLGLLVIVIAMLGVAPAVRADDLGAPFRAKLVSNVVVARKAATSLSSIAKQSPPKNLSADEKKAWVEHSKALAAAAARFGSLKARMDAVLAKTNAPPSQLAQINLELATAQQESEQESQRFAVAAALKARHEAAMKAIR